MFAYFSKSTSKQQPPIQSDDSKHEIPTYVAISKIDNFPSKIKKPSEQTRYENLTKQEIKISKHISSHYQSEISKCKFFPDDIIPRFVTDTYYITKYDDRLKLTKTRFEQYLKHHMEFHFDDILILPSLNTEAQLQIQQQNVEILSVYYYGIDNEGHPMVWDNGSAFGAGDKIKETFCNDDYKRSSYYRCRLQRMQRNLSLKLSNHFQCKISKVCLVWDMTQFTVSDFYSNRAFHQWNLRSSSELFPETMHKLFIINAPWTFQMIWKLCKNFLDAITVEKTIILGSNYLDELLKYMDITMIPKEFGGKGIWESRPGNVPVKFPFQMDNIKTELEVDVEDHKEKVVPVYGDDDTKMTNK